MTAPAQAWSQGRPSKSSRSLGQQVAEGLDPVAAGGTGGYPIPRRRFKIALGRNEQHRRIRLLEKSGFLLIQRLAGCDTEENEVGVLGLFFTQMLCLRLHAPVRRLPAGRIDEFKRDTGNFDALDQVVTSRTG